MGQSTVKAVNTPILHVEARLNSVDGGIVMRTDIVRDEIAKWLIDNFAVLSLGQEIKTFDGFKGLHSMYPDSIKVIECSGKQNESEAFRLDSVNLDVQAYQLRSSEPDTNLPQNHGNEKQEDECSPQARVMSLPNRELDGIWESRSLAQKLAIRLGRQFPQSKLVEINAYSLGSKFFSESGKLVAKMFDIVEGMLEDEPDTLVCVFIDEVETMTAQREQTLSGNDPLDAMRAVNSLLMALDRLRHHPNVVVLCTSNLLTALDSAFLDRVDIKQFIPPPSEIGVYEIFRSCLGSLSRCGLIEGSRFDISPVDPNDTETALKYIAEPADSLILPSYGETQLWYRLFPESIPKQLADISQMSVGLSGRSLRRIPALSLVLYTSYEVCTVDQALAALRRGVEEELKRSSSTASGSQTQSPFYLTLTASAATATAIGSMAWYYHLYGDEAFAMTPAEEGLHATQYPWEHSKWLKTFDHAALRRGFLVYREVCAQCHSLTRVPWRSFVGVMHTVDEMKAMAEEHEYDTEPNDQGEIEKRPGKLSDYIPAPYKNDEAARAANNGALPPDLSLIVKARHGGCDYIFSLLTGYPDEPPAGASVQEGLNFNPYFPGTGIAMARVLFDGLVEYDDGTPATTSQMAKDVTEFLNWTAEPEMDERKKMGMKAIVILSALFAVSVWVKRYKWATIKTRKIVYNPPIGPKR
ncbi:cytochrome c1 [Microsporum canis]